MRKKITRFTKAVILDFKPDGLLFGAQEEYEKTLNLLLSSHQFFDFVDGLKYAEKEFLAKEIKTFSFSDLETFIKGLHERVANNLLLAESGTKAGEYTQIRIHVRKESSISGQEYNHNYEKNYDIVKREFGNKEMLEYKDFVQKINAMCEQKEQEERDILEQEKNMNNEERAYRISKLDLFDLLENSDLVNHPGFNVLKRMFDIIPHPRNIHERMTDFLQEMIGFIKRNETPYKIAAKALMLSWLHPFSNANGRVSRILANCILMSYGYQPIPFETIKRKLHLAVESKDPNKLEALISAYINTQPVYDDQMFKEIKDEELYDMKNGSFLFRRECYVRKMSPLQTHSYSAGKKYLVNNFITFDWLANTALNSYKKNLLLSSYCFLYAAKISLAENNKSEAVILYRDAILNYMSIEKFESAYFYAKEALTIAVEEKNKSSLNETLSKLNFLNPPIVQTESSHLTGNLSAFFQKPHEAKGGIVPKRKEEDTDMAGNTRKRDMEEIIGQNKKKRF